MLVVGLLVVGLSVVGVVVVGEFVVDGNTQTSTISDPSEQQAVGLAPPNLHISSLMTTAAARFTDCVMLYVMGDILSVETLNVEISAE